jgi:DNA (cytosine-5)-methyltransferase 1
MKHIGLFEGIGGFSLAARWAGWETVAWCEWNEFGQKVLRHHFPKAKGHGDITKTDFTIYRGQCDIITGGFPCQPYSQAGKRLGKEDERHLWPEMLRAIREVQPRWVVGENVLGLVNWSGGLVFHEVQADLEAEGYEVFPYVLPACAVNAPHRRDRVWFVAYNQHNGNRRREQQQESEQKTNRTSKNTGSNGCSNGEYDKQISKRNEWEFSTGSKERIFVGEALQNDTNTNCNGCDKCNCNNEKHTSKGGFNAQCNFEQVGESITNPDSIGQNGRHEQRKPIERRHHIGCASKNDVANTKGGRLERHGKCGNALQPSGDIGAICDSSGDSTHNERPRTWERFPETEPTIRGGNDGVSAKLDGITIPKWRNESIKAFGNAIVPQVAFQIFQAINEFIQTDTI